MGVPEIIAHRGASADAPENTLEAFELAIAQGAARMELDVQLTSDGQPVITHDPTLDRTTDVAARHPDRAPWSLRDFAAHEVAALATTWPTGTHGNGTCRVATLQGVLAALRGRTRLLLELKDPALHPGVLEATARALAAEPWWLDPASADRLTVQSFDHDAVTAIRQLLPPHVRYGWLYDEGVVPVLDELPTWVSQVVVDHRVVDAATLSRVHAEGRQLVAWTVNEPERMRELAELGVDAIITDLPAMLHDLLREPWIGAVGGGHG